LEPARGAPSGVYPHQQHQSDADRRFSGAGRGRAGRHVGWNGRDAVRGLMLVGEPPLTCKSTNGAPMTSTLQPSQLGTPPQPPIPALERPLSPEALEQALRSFQGSYYVEHPFHKLMYEGKLSQRQFQGWVANRLAYQRVVPRKDAAILSNCPDADVRRVW